NGAFAEQHAITPPRSWLVDVAPGPSGSTAVLYVYPDPNNPLGQAGVAIRRAGSAFGTIAPLPGLDRAARFDGKGDLAISTYGATEDELATFTVHTGGQIGPSRGVYSGDKYSLGWSDLAVAPDGTTTLVWRSYGGDVLSATAPPGGDF